MFEQDLKFEFLEAVNLREFVVVVNAIQIAFNLYRIVLNKAFGPFQPTHYMIRG